jgi:hypothetical protein
MESAAQQQAPVSAPRVMAAPTQPLTPDPQVLAAASRNPLAGINVREMTTATVGVIEGAPGSWASVLLGTGLRAGVIGAALYFYPKSSKKLAPIAGQAVAASSAVTLVLLAGHAVLKRP